jgi:hypothetical protein
MRVWAAGALLVVGCNRIFGISETGSLPPADAIDAAYFDAPADAPFECPPIGTAPQFSRQLNQIIQQCVEYSLSTTGRAAGLCYDGVSQVSEGPSDGPLMPIAGLEQDSELHIDYVRYAPEGDELFVRIWHQSTVVGRIAVYRKSGTAWVPAYDVALPGGVTTDSFVRFGSPSRGPLRRMMVRNTSSVSFDEIEFDSTGASTLVQTYDAASIGATSLSGFAPNLSGDGLRMLVSAPLPGNSNAAAYAGRASLANPFGTAMALSDVPYSASPFMSDDCARVYFPALNYMFWVQRL